jgi:hypothetical protein
MAWKPSEEEIAAWVDGVLGPDDARRVAEAVAADPDLAAAAERLRNLNALLRETYRAPLDEPVPERIAAALQGQPPPVQGTVVPFRRPARAAWAPAALAAGVALAAGIGLGWLVQPREGASVRFGTGPVAADSALHAALETLSSGTLSAGGIVPVLTLRDAGGRICREFEIAGGADEALTFGLACRAAGGGWSVAILVEAPPGAPVAQGFEPAAGPAADALGALVEGLGAVPLAPAEEAGLIGRGWQ